MESYVKTITPILRNPKQSTFPKGWERPVHGPRLNQKTGLPDSYVIAKTEVQLMFYNIFTAQNISNLSLLLSWRLRRERRRRRGKEEGRKGERRGKRRREEQKRWRRGKK